jgi:hypothetical protein
MKPGRKRLLGITKREWDKNIKTKLTEIGQKNMTTFAWLWIERNGRHFKNCVEHSCYIKCW